MPVGLQPRRPNRDHDIFEESDAESNILIVTTADGSSSVKAATLPKLVQRATLESNPDLSFLDCFLLTYRSFCTPHELIKLLTARFKTPVPAGLSQSETDDYVNYKQKPIRARVINAFKIWIKTFYFDFLEEESVVAALTHFASSTLAKCGMESFGAQLQRLVEEARSSLAQGTRPSQGFGTNPPPPILPTNLGSVSLMTIDPEELARQLTVIEFGLFTAIRPWEFLGQAWSKNREKAPNILAMIHWSNHVGCVVWTTILQPTDPRERATAMKQWIRVAEHCRQMNNFNAVMEILSAMGNACLNRLKQSIPLLPSKELKQLEDLRTLMSPNQNSKAIRDLMGTIAPPCIPYIGLFLTDLTFIEDGNQDFLTEHNLINWDKRRKVSAVILQVRQFQQLAYCLSPVAPIQEWYKQVVVLDANAAYELSLLREPKASSAAGSLAPALVRTRSTTMASALAGIGSGPKTLVDPLEAIWGTMQPYDPLEYPFSLPDIDKFIVYDSAGLVKFASLPKLIEKITLPGTIDTNLLNAVILFHLSYCSQSTFIELFSKRFNIPLPMNGAKINDFKKEYVEPVRIRLFNALKTWINKCSRIISETSGTVDELSAFLDKVAAEHADGVPGKLASAIKGSLVQKVAKQYHFEVPRWPESSRMGTTTLLDVDASLFANFLTKNERTFYENVDESEWAAFCSHPTSTKFCSNILGWKAWQTALKNWVGSELIRHLDLNVRITSFTQILNIMSASFDINNFSSACTIASTLRKLSKLGLFKALLPGTPRTLLTTLEKVQAIARDMKKANAAMEPVIFASRPCVPPFELYCDSLEATFAGSLLNDGLINFRIRLQALEMIHSFNRAQAFKYLSLRLSDAVPEYIEGVPIRIWSDIEDTARILATPIKTATDQTAAGASSSSSSSTTPQPAPSSPLAPASSPIASSSSSQSLAQTILSPSSSSAAPSPAHLSLNNSDAGPPIRPRRFSGTPSAAASSSSPASSSDSPPNSSPRATIAAKPELTDEAVTARILRLLRTDQNFAQQLRRQLHEKEYVKESLADLRRTMKNSLAVSSSFMGNVDTSELNRARKELVSSRFPTDKVTEILVDDPTGSVLGWPSSFQFFVVQSGTTKHLVSVCSHVGVDELAIILRSLALCLQKHELSVVRRILLVISVSPEVIELLPSKQLETIALLD